jgi:hypothetical protein
VSHDYQSNDGTCVYICNYISRHPYMDISTGANEMCMCMYVTSMWFLSFLYCRALRTGTEEQRGSWRVANAQSASYRTPTKGPPLQRVRIRTMDLHRLLPAQNFSCSILYVVPRETDGKRCNSSFGHCSPAR